MRLDSPRNVGRTHACRFSLRFHHALLVLLLLAVPMASSTARAEAAKDEPKVECVEDFLDKHISKNTMIKKFISDRIVNQLHDGFDTGLKKIVTPETDLILSPTDWMQSIDHAANGEFDKLKLLVGEAIAKKIIETLLPGGGKLLTQAYDYSKIMAIELAAWGKQNEVKEFMKEFLTRRADFFKVRYYRECKTKDLKSIFNEIWNDPAVQLKMKGEMNWFTTRTAYRNALKTTCWNAMVDFTCKYRNHLRDLEQIEAAARAERIDLILAIKNARRELRQCASHLYYLGEINSRDVEKHAVAIVKYRSLTKEERKRFIDEARKRNAKKIAAGGVVRLKERVKRFEDRCAGMIKGGSPTSGLRGLSEPDTSALIPNVNKFTSQFLGGYITYGYYARAKAENEKALDNLALAIGGLCEAVRKEKAKKLKENVAASVEAEEEALKHGNALLSRLATARQELKAFQEKLEERVKAKATEKGAEFKAIFGMKNVGGDLVQLSEQRAEIVRGFYESFDAKSAVQRLLATNPPDVNLFYESYQQIGKKVEAGTIDGGQAAILKERVLAAWGKVYSAINETVNEANAQLAKGDFSDHQKIKCKNKANSLFYAIQNKKERFEREWQIVQQKINRAAKEKKSESERALRSRGSEALSGKERTAAGTPAEVASRGRIGGQTRLQSAQFLNRLTPQGDVTAYTHKVEADLVAAEKSASATAAEMKKRIKNDPSIAALEKKAADLIQESEPMANWVNSNPHWVDFFLARRPRECPDDFKYAHQYLEDQALSIAVSIDKIHSKNLNIYEAAAHHAWVAENQAAYAGVTLPIVRERVDMASALSAETTRLVGTHGRIDFNLAVHLPGVLHQTRAEGLVKRLRETPDEATLAHLDLALEHYDQIRRDLGTNNYAKVLAPDYVQKNKGSLELQKKIPTISNIFYRWDRVLYAPMFLKDLRSIQPRFKEVLKTVNAIPEEDAKRILKVHEEALELQKQANAVPMQRWEDPSIDKAVNGVAALKKLAQQIAWIRLANERLDAAIVNHERLKAYVLKHEPRDRQRIIALLEKGEGIEKTQPKAALALAQQALNHLRFVMLLMPYGIRGYKELHERGFNLASRINNKLNRTADDIYDFPAGGNYHITINGISSSTMRKWQANKIASADGNIEIRTESYDPLFRNAKKVMIAIFTGSRPKRLAFTTVSRKGPDFVHRLKVPFDQPHTIEIQIVTDKLTGHTPLQYPLNFHWGQMPIVNVGKVKVIRIRKKGEWVSFSGKLGQALELKLTTGNATAPAEVHVLGLADVSLYGQKPQAEYGMLRGQWVELTPFSRDPDASKKFTSHSTEEEEGKGLRFWEMQANIEANEQYNVFQKFGNEWRLVAHVIGMNVKRPVPPQGGGQPPKKDYSAALAKPLAEDKVFVPSLLQAVLDAAPDTQQVPQYLAQLTQGTPRQKAIMDLFNSAGYQNRRVTDRQFVRDAYQAIPGREPSAMEVSDLLLKLSQGTPRDTALKTLFNSTEYAQIQEKRKKGSGDPNTHTGGNTGGGNVGGGTVGGGITGGEPVLSGLRVRAATRRARPNTSVTVPIHLEFPKVFSRTRDGRANVANLNVEVAYDPSVVRPAGKVIKGNLMGGCIFQANASKPGVIKIGFATNGRVQTSGTLAQIPFRVVGQPGQGSPLNVRITTVNAEDGSTPQATVGHGSIRVQQKVVVGDFNGNGIVDASDALAALKMSLDLIPEDLILNVDKQGGVTSNDARLLLKMATKNMTVPAK